ncbi:MAG: FHA domain-containing protein, partial [bacterium]|nr:FHA domain-containing protein [bacterium]
SHVNMSLNRFVYYCAVIGGWAAFAAWLLLERAIRHLGSLGETEASIGLWAIIATTVTATGVGGAIGGGLGFVSGTDRPWLVRVQHALLGLIGGAVGGLIGGLVGAVLHTYAGLPRAFGWMIMGLAIGAAEGIYQNSFHRVRNGAIGGALGGLLGGYLFDVLARPGAEMASRALAFVVLGAAIGALIGLTHVVLKRAWLTVLDGFRPGRQLILDQLVTTLGRGDHLPLPLLGPTSRELESEHAKITRRSDGAFVVEDSSTRLGTLLNGERLLGPVVLADGDLLRLGGNILRFNDRGGVSASPRTGKASPPPIPGASPPPLPEAPGSSGSKPPSVLPGGAVAPRPVRSTQPRPPAPKPPGPGPKLPPPPPPPTPLR